MTTPTPFHTTRAPRHMVSSADALATQAGLAILAQGGNAVDAAIATNAAIAVTGPHLCGMGAAPSTIAVRTSLQGRSVMRPERPHVLLRSLSWKATSAPSAVTCTSVSTYLYPASTAYWKAGIVFSGTSLAPPRCANGIGPSQSR